MQASIFIPAEKLGELIYQRCDDLALADSIRRDRQREFHNIQRMMRSLHIIPDGLKVLVISTGVRSDGEKGAVITFENSQVASMVPNA